MGCYQQKMSCEHEILVGLYQSFYKRKCNKEAGKTVISCSVRHYYKDRVPPCSYSPLGRPVPSICAKVVKIAGESRAKCKSEDVL